MSEGRRCQIVALGLLFFQHPVSNPATFKLLRLTNMATIRQVSLGISVAQEMDTTAEDSHNNLADDTSGARVGCGVSALEALVK